MERTIEEAVRVGLGGVEFAQKRTSLPSPHGLASLMRKNRLKLLSVAGGGCLRDREYYAELVGAEYLIIDTLDIADLSVLPNQGLPIAVHPNPFNARQVLHDFKGLSEKSSRLMLSLDIAFLHVAGFSGSGIVAQVAQMLPRIAAIHLKDWTRGYGVSAFNFGYGFAVPGTGAITTILEDILIVLQESRFDGWIIVEQRLPSNRAERSLDLACEWLRRVRLV